LKKENDEIPSSKPAVFLILIVRVIGSGFSSGTVDPVTSTFSHLAAGESVVECPPPLNVLKDTSRCTVTAVFAHVQMTIRP
jgi:hypothetical protein